MIKNYALSFFKAIILTLVFVQPHVLATQAPEQAKKTQQLQHQLQKKVQLIEYILLDIEKKSATLFATSTLFAESFKYSKNELNFAKKALNEADNKAAKEHIDQAFINMTYARSFMQKPAISAKVSLAQYQKLQQSVNEFQQSLQQTLAEHTDPWGEQQQNQVQQLITLADSLFAKNNIAAAKPKLDDAYRILVMTLSRLKDKQTTTISLDFATPKDEYEYELKRQDSFQMLVNMRKADLKLSDKALASIDKYVEKSNTHAQKASIAVKQKNYVAAIKMLELANEELKRALRTTGLNIL